MELKNAAAVCLVSMFSATLVLLIARSLDNQAAARLEPQLASIAEELQAIRTQGGIMTAAGRQCGRRRTDRLLFSRECSLPNLQGNRISNPRRC